MYEHQSNLNITLQYYVYTCLPSRHNDKSSHIHRGSLAPTNPKEMIKTNAFLSLRFLIHYTIIYLAVKKKSHVCSVTLNFSGLIFISFIVTGPAASHVA